MVKKKIVKKKKVKRIKRVKTENKKGAFVFTGKDKKKYRLTVREKLFCELFLDLQGNGTQAAESAYNCKKIGTATSIAYDNLTKVHIMAYINKRLDERGFNDDNVEKQHLFVLNQFGDLSAKNKAIDMFYKLKGNYSPEKIQILKRKYQGLSNAELAERIKKAKDFLLKR